MEMARGATRVAEAKVVAAPGCGPGPSGCEFHRSPHHEHEMIMTTATSHRTLVLNADFRPISTSPLSLIAAT